MTRGITDALLAAQHMTTVCDMAWELLFGDTCAPKEDEEEEP